MAFGHKNWAVFTHRTEQEKEKGYLVIFVDEATRFFLHGEFYPVLNQVIVEDCFRKAIGKFGVPDKVYFDYAEEKTMPKKAGDAPYTCASS